MTRYTVIWRMSAIQRLAAIWLNAPDPQQVTMASDAIDAELAVDAGLKGAPVGSKLRRLMIYPLEVLFAVLEADRQVHVLAVKRV